MGAEQPRAQLALRARLERSRENFRESLPAITGRPHERQRFSMVTMDCEMAFMDGDEATKKAREAGYTGPIAMVSGNAFTPAQKADLLKLGVTANWSNPIAL